MKLSYLALLCAAVLLAACDNDSSSNKKSAYLRISHASPDAPRVNIYLDGEREYENVDYKDSTGSIRIKAGEPIELEVRGILADGSELSVIGPVTVEADKQQLLDVVAYDTLFSGAGLNIKAQTVLTEVPKEDEATVTIFHAAPAVAGVDIYVTPVNANIADYTPIDADFGDVTNAVQLSADEEYRIRITGDGSNTVVYDSGAVSFAANADYLVAAVANTTGIGDNPVNLLVIDEEGASEVFDANTLAEVRVVHNSADTPAVDVLVGGAEALDALSFPDSTDYEQLAAPSGSYNVVVAADADNSIAPIDEQLTLQAGSSYTVVAIGGLNAVVDETLEALVTVDDRRSVASEARLRVIHGSYAVAENIPVDVYLTPSAVLTGASPAIENLAYGEATEQLPVAAGSYFVSVTAAGDASVIAFQTAAALDLNAGGVYTVIARDPGGAEVGAPLILVSVLAE